MTSRLASSVTPSGVSPAAALLLAGLALLLSSFAALLSSPSSLTVLLLAVHCLLCSLTAFFVFESRRLRRPAARPARCR